MTWKGGFRVSRPKQKSALIAQTIVILKEKNEEKKTQSNFIFPAEGQIIFYSTLFKARTVRFTGTVIRISNRIRIT